MFVQSTRGSEREPERKLLYARDLNALDINVSCLVDVDIILRAGLI